MNVLETYTIESPYGSSEECAKITIFDTAEWFILSDTTTVGVVYTFSAWIKSDAEGSFTVGESYIKTSSEWARHKATFTADDVDLKLIFSTPGTYYVYHPQLEIGTVATDWSPSPEDTEEGIMGAQNAADGAQNAVEDAVESIVAAETTLQLLEENIKMLVVDENGESLMEQTSSGWTFSTSAIQGQVNAASELLSNLVEQMGSTEAAIDRLSNSIDEFGVIAEFIHTGSYTYTDENGNQQTEPCIDLFETDTGFKLKITNTRIMFTDGATPLVNIDSKNKSLTTPKATVDSELQIGGESRTDGVWIWKHRANGNLGLSWKEVDN